MPDAETTRTWTLNISTPPSLFRLKLNVQYMAAGLHKRAPQRQRRTRHAATNTPGSSNATVESLETSSWSQSQLSHLPFPQPTFVVPSNVPRPQPPTTSRSHLYHPSVPSNAPPLGPLSPYRLPLSSQHVTGTEASPVPPLLHQPQPISPFYRSHPIVPSNAPLGPSLAVPTTPVKPARDVNALTSSEGSFEHAFREPSPSSSTTSRTDPSPLFHPCF
ncbi:hypothetical protein EDB83DRAFT_2537746 [Lactarius deliciosus]|nr:hypothetical protein EDB83DRAFT_2537746 [Lactarius deliciosus]